MIMSPTSEDEEEEEVSNIFRFVHNVVQQDDYADEEEDDEVGVEQIEKAIRNKGRKRKKEGECGHWPESYVDDLIDIILEDDKFKLLPVISSMDNCQLGQSIEPG